MTNFIYGYDNWRKIYLQSPELKKNIWIFIKLNNDQDIYLSKYDHWFDLKKYILDKNYTVKELGLRYRSNQIVVNTEDCDGIYLVRSIKGEFGGRIKECYTIGKLKNNIVSKTMWLTPELIEESSFIDNIEECFEEAIIQYGQKIKTNTV